MSNQLLSIVIQQTKRHYVRVMTFVVVCCVAVVVWLVMSTPEVVAPEMPYEATTSTFGRSAPARLVIPKLNLDTSFVAPLGLNADRTIAVPDVYDAVGWYSGGASPGEVGAAVILGHVDSVDGPAVFYTLGQLGIGDELSVLRDDGSTAKFIVERLERHLQSDFPTLAVYGPVDYPALRLVTCSGSFDKGLQRYSHNLVVYARLVE
jgi:sortase (surface protein transpeptidase)